MVMKELIRFDDETQRTFLKEVSGNGLYHVMSLRSVTKFFYSEAESTVKSVSVDFKSENNQYVHKSFP